MKVYDEWVKCLPVRGCEKPLTIKTLREMKRLIYDSCEMDCHFCHESKGAAQWLIGGHGMAHVCQSCIDAGMVYDVTEEVQK